MIFNMQPVELAQLFYLMENDGMHTWSAYHRSLGVVDHYQKIEIEFYESYFASQPSSFSSFFGSIVCWSMLQPFLVSRTILRGMFGDPQI